MMGLFDCIIGALRGLSDWFVDVLKRVINFLQDIVGWFKSQRLDPKKHTPFIVKCDNEIREMLHRAPRKDGGIFKVYLDEVDGTITGYEMETDKGVDAKTEEVLGGEKIVVLQ